MARTATPGSGGTHRGNILNGAAPRYPPAPPRRESADRPKLVVTLTFLAASRFFCSQANRIAGSSAGRGSFKYSTSLYRHQFVPQVTWFTPGGEPVGHPRSGAGRARELILTFAAVG